MATNHGRRPIPEGYFLTFEINLNSPTAMLNEREDTSGAGGEGKHKNSKDISSTNYLPGVLGIICCRVCAYTAATFVELAITCSYRRAELSLLVVRSDKRRLEVWNDLLIAIPNYVTFHRSRFALRTHYYRLGFDNMMS